MTTPQELVLEQLTEVHAIEAALITNLRAHIAMTPEGDYRALLERHLSETRDQTRALEDRMRELGHSRGVVQSVIGLAELAIGQALVLTKGPLDMLRGKSGEEKLLKNARDEVVTEALEIAAYDGLEQLAELAGDTRTAELARRHREQEERMLEDLRGEIPSLATAFFRALTGNEPSFDVSTTGAAQTARRFARGREEERSGGPITRATLPIHDYDALTGAEVRRQLGDLDSRELDVIEQYERENQARPEVLERIEALQAKAGTSG